MKPLQDCEYTAFISYAHADDEVWFRWITQFRNELECSLRAMLRGQKLPAMHLSGDNGPVAGVLGESLKARVAASFAMIIVVHDNYAQSPWCLRELEYFKELFGEQGLRQRLYVVALSESAMARVTSGSDWRRLVADGEQLWMPFFDATDRDRPLDIYLGQGIVSPAFRAPFERLRCDLAAKLRAASAVAAAAPSGAGAAPQVAARAAPAAGRSAGLLFGFVPAATATAAAAAVEQLGAAGLPARLLSQDIVFTEFADFDGADDLVLAFDDSPLMLASMAPGGHLQLQRDAWIKRGRPAARVHWLDLRGAPPPPPWQGSAAAAQSLGAEPLALPALLARLKPAAPAGGAAARAPRSVRIYIESNRHERSQWEALGEQIRRQWEVIGGQLAPGRTPPLSLRAHGLPVDQIDSFPHLDDADGVVLLWGRKTSEALVAQINKVEGKMAPGRDAAPGIVAYLMPPQQASEPVPAWGWQVLRFNASSEDDIDLVSEESGQLDRFLRKVYRRHQQRDAEEGAA